MWREIGIGRDGGLGGMVKHEDFLVWKGWGKMGFWWGR